MTHPDPATPLPPSLHHLALRAVDVERTAGFYRDVFGFVTVRDQRPRSLWLGIGGGAVMMVEAREPGEPVCAPGTRELFAFAVTAERKEAIRRLAVEQGCFDGETPHTVYLRDPDGRRAGASTYRLD